MMSLSADVAPSHRFGSLRRPYGLRRTATRCASAASASTASSTRCVDSLPNVVVRRARRSACIVPDTAAPNGLRHRLRCSPGGEERWRRDGSAGVMSGWSAIMVTPPAQTSPPGRGHRSTSSLSAWNAGRPRPPLRTRVTRGTLGSVAWSASHSASWRFAVAVLTSSRRARSRRRSSCVGVAASRPFAHPSAGRTSPTASHSVSSFNPCQRDRRREIVAPSLPR